MPGFLVSNLFDAVSIFLSHKGASNLLQERGNMIITLHKRHGITTQVHDIMILIHEWQALHVACCK